MRYRLRTLLIIVTLISIWLGYHLRWIRQRESAIRWIESQASYWDDVPIQQGAIESASPPWRIASLGAPGVKIISVMAKKHEKEPKQKELERLFPEAKVYVMTTGPGYHGKH